MDAIELLERMRETCKTKCFCELSLDDDDNLVLRWSGTLKIDKHGDKKNWGLVVRVPLSHLCSPHYLDRSLFDAEIKIARLFTELAGVSDEAIR